MALPAAPLLSFRRRLERLARSPGLGASGYSGLLQQPSETTLNVCPPTETREQDLEPGSRAIACQGAFLTDSRVTYADQVHFQTSSTSFVRRGGSGTLTPSSGRTMATRLS